MNKNSRKYIHYEIDSIMKGILEKKLHQYGELGFEPFIVKTLSELLANQ